MKHYIHEKKTIVVSNDAIDSVIRNDTLLCAWCLSEQGLEMGNGSHGICAMHAGHMRAQAMERKAVRGGSGHH